MNILTPSLTGSLPGYLFHQPPCVNEFPHVVEIGDAWGKIGSGVSHERSAELTALWEYFERRHFYMEVMADRKATLDSVLDVDEAVTFRDAFLQTSRQVATTTHIEQHSFGMTRAYRTRDFSACFIPTVMLNLTHIKGDPDNELYPDRDTCGCSFHLSSELSIFGAIKESLERQFLTKFWLTKQCNYKWHVDELRRQLHKRPLQGLLDLLGKAGELLALDISDEQFPGKRIILTYGSRDPSRNVRYCAGMAYAGTLIEAVEKSLLELWQTFRFMQLFGALKKNTDNVEDSYLRHFLNCNSIATFEEIAATSEPPKPPEKVDIDGPELSANTLLNALRQLNIEGYLYSQKTAHSGNFYTFTKFVSPSFFLHMNNAQGINICNKYSNSFIKDIQPARRAVMVPFP